jgi:hypothetical protein
MMVNSVNPRMRRLLEGELRSGERVVWSQQPSPASLAFKSSMTFLFGIPFFAFSVFWTIGASGGLDSFPAKKGAWPLWFPLLWGGMFMAVGAGLLLSPLWAWCKALNTVYAITDQRAILIQAFWRKTTCTFAGSQLLELHRIEDDRGQGDIVFHREARSGRRGDSYYDVGFLGISKVREVEDLLREVHKKTRGT